MKTHEVDKVKLLDDIFKELLSVKDGNHAHQIDKLTKEYNDLKSNLPISSLNFLKFITRCYTAQAFYLGINGNLANRNSKKVKKYIRSLIDFLEMNP